MPIPPCLFPKDSLCYKAWKTSLKKRPPPWNLGKTKKTDNRVRKIADTLKARNIDNFAKWREKAYDQGLIVRSDTPLTQDKTLAFLTGLILGDGHLRKFPRTELLSITLGTNRPLLYQHAAKVVENIFRKKPATRHRKDAACVDIRLYQNNLSARLKIPTGARKNLDIKLANWIWDKEEFLIESLKGLFEAEGSFSIHQKTYTYNFSFSNRNTSLLDEVEKALYLLGFHPERRWNAVRLRKRNEALSFEKLIRFRTYSLI
jgi:hypothetical protein